MMNLIKMALVALVVAMMAGAAFAQTSAPPPPSCWPSQIGGSGTYAKWVEVQPDDDKTVSGYALWWHCRTAYEVTSTAILTCRSDKLGQCLTPDVSSLLANSYDGGKVASLWGARVKSFADSGDPWIAAVAWQDHVKADARSQVPQWTVATNGVFTTRPAFPLVGGVRSQTSTARATVSATCDCKVRSVEGKSTYCAHDEARLTVTLCRPI